MDDVRYANIDIILSSTSATAYRSCGVTSLGFTRTADGLWVSYVKLNGVSSGAYGVTPHWGSGNLDMVVTVRLVGATTWELSASGFFTSSGTAHAVATTWYAPGNSDYISPSSTLATPYENGAFRWLSSLPGVTAASQPEADVTDENSSKGKNDVVSTMAAKRDRLTGYLDQFRRSGPPSRTVFKNGVRAGLKDSRYEDKIFTWGHGKSLEVGQMLNYLLDGTLDAIDKFDYYGQLEWVRIGVGVLIFMFTFYFVWKRFVRFAIGLSSAMSS